MTDDSYAQLLADLRRDLQLDATTDILPGTILQALLRTPRTISWGLVNGAASSISAGSGDFTVTRSAAGSYVLHNPAWSATAAVLVTPTNSGGGATVANVNGISAGQAGVVTFLSTTGAPVDTFFSFIVISL